MTESKTGSCSVGCAFNYCTVAKILVAIPALPIAAHIVGSLFDNPVLQYGAGVGTMIALIYAAIRIDQIPALRKKIVTPKSKD